MCDKFKLFKETLNSEQLLFLLPRCTYSGDKDAPLIEKSVLFIFRANQTMAANDIITLNHNA